MRMVPIIVRAGLALWNAVIAPETRRDPATLRQAQRVAAFGLSMYVWAIVFAGIFFAISAPISACIVLSGAALLTLVLYRLRCGMSPIVCGNLLNLAALYVYTVLALVNGGVGAPCVAWYASVPVLGILLSGTGWGSVWTASSLLAISGLAAARELGWPLYNEISPGGFRFLQFAGMVGLVTCIWMLVSLLKRIEQNAQRALHDANERLELLASTDALTGICNRRSFNKKLEQEWKRHERMRIPLSALLIDIDLFKQYNDLYGHLAGDRCLKLIAQVIEASARRPGDFAARYGGEEFALVLCNTDERAAAAIAESLRLRVKALEIANPRSPVCAFVTISVGSTTIMPSDFGSPLDALDEADIALYRAKANGRDQSVHFSSELAEVPHAV